MINLKSLLLENYSKYFDDLLSGERSLPFGLLVLCFFTQEVSDAALEKRLQLETHDLGPKFESLKREYGQTPSNKSLYNLFETFKETALNPVR